MNRVYLDLEYWINNLIIEGTEDNKEIKSNLDKTFENIMNFTSYYDQEIKSFFSDIEASEEKIEEEEEPQEKIDRSFNKKIKMTYSEPNLNLTEPSSPLNEELQMSCIERKIDTQEDNTINNSDKVSQEESSFSEFETLL
jgi:hypothetical protein